MATYRKLLKNRAGDTIIPVVDYPDPDLISMSIDGGSSFRTTSGTSYLKFGETTATFAGGTYVFDIRDLYVTYNSASYNAYYYISVDGGNKIQFSMNSSFGGPNTSSRVLIGQITGVLSINIPAGSHTIELGMATNNANKTITTTGWNIVNIFANRVWTYDPVFPGGDNVLPLVIPVDGVQGNTATGNYAWNEYTQKSVTLNAGKYLISWYANTINTPAAADQTQCRTKVVSGATELSVSNGMAPACANRVYRPCALSYTQIQVGSDNTSVTLSLQIQTETAGTYGMYGTSVIIQRIQ